MRVPADTTQTDAVQIALEQSHTVVPRVTAMIGGQLKGVLAVVEGSVVYDETAEIQGQCGLSYAVPEAFPPDEFDVREVDVTGWKLFVEYGIRLSGTVAYVPVGTFYVYSVEDVDSPQGHTIRISGLDATALVRDARLETPFSVASGTSYTTAAQDLVRPTGLPFAFPGTAHASPGVIFEEGSDRLAKLKDIGAAVGWTIVADVDGQITTGAPGNRSDVGPRWSYVEGLNCRMQSIARLRTRQQVYNIAVVVGEPPGGVAPVRGAAYDDDPKSPTFANANSQAPFGRVPVFERSQLITTQAQVDAAAIALRDRKKGVGTSFRIESQPNPLLEPGDTVRVKRERLGVDATVAIKSVSLNLVPGQPMSVMTRESNI